jgi:hypothetical protein
MATIQRSRILLGAGLMALVFSLSSCAAATIVPNQGSVADLPSLAGEWTGTYTSPDFGRQGTIWFKLVDGEDHAHGDVRMVPRTGQPYAPNPRPGPQREPIQFLGIRFVLISSNTVSGELDRYWDPDAGCLATTIFRGRLSGDRLEGTFETTLATGTTAGGRWQASRRIYK